MRGSFYIDAFFKGIFRELSQLLEIGQRSDRGAHTVARAHGGRAGAANREGEGHHALCDKRAAGQDPPKMTTALKIER